MPAIACRAKDCIHHNQEKHCGVQHDATVDIDADGVCLDHSPITSDERLVMLGGGFDSKSKSR
jgi:hypothetical protein